MKALVYQGPKKVDVIDVPDPQMKENHVSIDIKYCGVCGSDRGIFSGNHPRAKAPLILGHEFLGVVTEDSSKFKKGDRVVAYPLISCGECLACRTGNKHVCNTLGLLGIDVDGGICERMVVDENLLYKVPDTVSDRAAVLTEPLAVLVHAVHQANFQLRSNAVVIGAGPIGLLAGLVLKQSGASEVFVSDIRPKSLERVEKLGLIPINAAEQDLNEIIKERTNGEGCDYLFECSGSESAALEMTEITRVRGGIVMVATHGSPHRVNLQQINFKEQWIIGSRVYTEDDFEKAVEFTKDIQPELEMIISHEIPLMKAPTAFDLYDDSSNPASKIIIDCRLD